MSNALVSDSASVSGRGLNTVGHLSRCNTRVILMANEAFCRVLPRLASYPCVSCFICSGNTYVCGRNDKLIFSGYVPTTSTGGVCSVLDSCRAFVRLCAGNGPLISRTGFYSYKFRHCGVSGRFLPRLGEDQVPIGSLSLTVVRGTTCVRVFSIFFTDVRRHTRYEGEVRARFPSFRVAASLSGGLRIVGRNMGGNAKVGGLYRVTKCSLGSVITFKSDGGSVAVFRTVRGDCTISGTYPRLGGVDGNVTYDGSRGVVL